MSLASPCHCSSAPPPPLVAGDHRMRQAIPIQELLLWCSNLEHLQASFVNWLLITAQFLAVTNHLVYAFGFLRSVCFPTLLLSFSVLHFNFRVWVCVHGGGLCRCTHRAHCSLHMKICGSCILSIGHQAWWQVFLTTKHLLGPRPTS